jgi:hypothetical protein
MARFALMEMDVDKAVGCFARIRKARMNLGEVCAEVAGPPKPIVAAKRVLNGAPLGHEMHRTLFPAEGNSYCDLEVVGIRAPPMFAAR